MENQQREQISRVLAGAAIGAGFAFLFMTKSGRKLLRSSQPWLDDVIQDMQRLRGAAAKVRDAVDEGRRSFESLANLGSPGATSGNTGRRQPSSSEARH